MSFRLTYKQHFVVPEQVYKLEAGKRGIVMDQHVMDLYQYVRAQGRVLGGGREPNRDRERETARGPRRPRARGRCAQEGAARARVRRMHGRPSDARHRAVRPHGGVRALPRALRQLPRVPEGDQLDPPHLPQLKRCKNK